MIKLKYFKAHELAHDIFWGSGGAACFDLRACIPPGTKIQFYNTTNERKEHTVLSDGALSLFPKYRYLVPTGLIFDIPENHSLRIHPRSGLAWKNGIFLTNAEGVIDEDYVEPTFIMLQQFTTLPQVIRDGDRIAQAELVPTLKYDISPTLEQPAQKSSRKGGFGSTGIQ